MGDTLPPPAQLDGTRFLQAGAGAALVFIHGVGMNAAIWQPQIRAFAAQRRVIAYDMLGHGDSALPPEHPTLADYAVQLRRLMDGLGLDRAAVVGHSMGALVALQFALDEPERVSCVASLNAVYCRSVEQRAAVMRRAKHLEGGRSSEGRQATLRRWFGNHVPDSLAPAVAQVERMLAEVDSVGYSRTYRLFACSDTAHAGRIGRLAVPALFLTGEDDPNSSPAMSRAMAEAAPQGRSVVMSGERHMMSLVSPDRINSELRAFLDGAEACPAGRDPATEAARP